MRSPLAVSRMGPRPVVMAMRRSAPSCPAFSRRMTRTDSRADFGISATIRSGRSGIRHPRDRKTEHPSHGLELPKLAAVVAPAVLRTSRFGRAGLRADLIQRGEMPAGEDRKVRGAVPRG